MGPKEDPALVKQYKTILIAEDSTFQRRTLSRQLNQWEYDVLETRDGREALKQFDAHSPKIVITDLHMPRMDGFELVRQIRQRETHYTYIIVISGMQDKDSIVAAISAGADDYISKPFHPGELEVRLTAAERIIQLQTQDLLIFAMAQLADYRSRETGNHLKRVQKYTRVLAEDLADNEYPQMTRARILLVENLSCLHDIGKVAVPDGILNKPGKLTRMEYSIMKKHTAIGGAMLEELYNQTSALYLKVARNIVMHHHERWDGSGYPDRLEGEDIPLSARIVALADVFDALSQERCYKCAFDRGTCRAIIKEERGRHFDPAVVDAFFRQEDHLYKIRDMYKDE